MLKRLFTVLTVATVIRVGASAQLNVFNHLGADVSVGTTGIGVELSTPITSYLQLRAGVSFMPDFSFSTSVDGEATAWNTSPTSLGVHEFDADIKAGLGRTQANVVFNVYPFGGNSTFFVAGGLYFGGHKIIGIKGHSDYIADLQAAGRLEDGAIEIGNYRLPFEPNGNVYGGLTVNKVRPYLGIGFGRACPKHRVGCMFELGVQFMGTMKVCQGKDLDPIDMSLIDSGDDWQKWMDKLTVYPMLKFTITGRIL